MNPSRSDGFTLIELSIVLVIIGLIVGGVLVGQDMIRAAQLRATVSQIEKYNTAANTFRSKYNSLPGDLVNPTNFGFNVTGATGATGAGDGNGFIQCWISTVIYCGELPAFWYELSQANLISEGITTNDMSGYNVTISNSVLPPAKIGKGNYITVGAGIDPVSGNPIRNYYAIAAISGATGYSGFGAVAAALTPMEAFQIDTKMDDGSPTTGIVVSSAAASSGSGSWTFNLNVMGNGGTGSGLTAGTCYDSALNIYATDSRATANVNGCTLRINAGF